MFNTWKLKRQVEALKKENKALRAQVEQKTQTIMYLNGCVNKANQRYLQILNQTDILKNSSLIDFPNTESQPALNQISIHDILEH